MENPLEKNITENIPNKEIWKNPWLKYVIIPLIVAVVGGLIVWAIVSMNDDNEPNVSVTSYNQQGGITANQVTFGNQARWLSPELKQQLDSLSQINKNKEITIDAILGDGEAFRFASEVKQYLVSKGWNVNGVNQVVWGEPVFGQNINPEATIITIGTKQ